MCVDCSHRQKLWACLEQRCDMIWLTSRCGVWNILWDSKTGKARLVKRWWDRRIRNPLVTSLRMHSVQWPGQKPGKTGWTVSEPECCLWCVFALTILRRVLLKETQKAMLQREGAMGSRETFRVRRKSVVYEAGSKSKKKQTLWWRGRRDSRAAERACERESKERLLSMRALWPRDKSVVRLPTVLTGRRGRWVSVAVGVCGRSLVNSLIFSKTETPWSSAKNDEWEKGRDVRKQMGDRADVVLVPGVWVTPEGPRNRKVRESLCAGLCWLEAGDR